MTPLFESRFSGTPKRRSVMVLSRVAGAAVFFAIMWVATIDARRPLPVREFTALANRAVTGLLAEGVAAAVTPYLIPARAAGRSTPVEGAVYELTSLDEVRAPRALPLRAGMRLAGTIATHTEKRRVAVCLLELARSDRLLGPNLLRASIDCDSPAPADEAAAFPPLPLLRGQAPPCDGVTGFGMFAVSGAMLPEIADYIADEVGTVVIDRTGILGRFDATLRWDAGNREGPSIVDALEDQFGLTLSTTMEETDVLVVDSVQGLTPKLKEKF